MFGRAFPPDGFSGLAFLVLSPLFVAIKRARSSAEAAALAWLWSLAAAWAVGEWFAPSVADYFQQSRSVGVALFFGVFTLMAAPYYATFALAYRVLARRYEAGLPLLAAAAWAGVELLRGRLFTGTPFFIGNPWGLLGYALTDPLPWVQVASLTGIYGVSFAAASVNAALAEIATGQRSWRIATAGLPALACLVFGLCRLPQTATPPAPATPIALVQGNADIGTRWRADFYGRNLEIYLRLTHEAATSGAPRVVFWPEAAMTFFLEDEPLYRRSIARVLGHHDLELVAGGPRVGGRLADRGATYLNTTFLIAPDGEIRDRYDKEYLVPFAEYPPFRIDVAERDFGDVRIFEHGRDVEPLPTRAGRAGVVVCNEVMLPEVVAQRVADGAEFLLNPSNDSWIDHPSYIAQQLDLARVRAIEQRRWLVRVSTSGPSVIVDPWGRTRTRTEPRARTFALGEISARSERTAYGRLGDAFGFACLAIVAVAILARRTAYHRSRGAGSPPATR